MAPDHVWSTDFTYFQLDQGLGRLTAILNGYSRKVLAWRLSNALETAFRLDYEALAHRQRRFHRPLGASRDSDQHGRASAGA